MNSCNNHALDPTTTLLVAAASFAHHHHTQPLKCPGGVPPLTPKVLLSLVPQLVSTATRTLLTTASALVKHVVIGPPHTSFTWQTTAVRAVLRTTLKHNPPASFTSFVLTRKLTQVTYPTSPHWFVYRPTWFVFHHHPFTSHVHQQQAYADSDMATHIGHASNYAVSGEFVSKLPRQEELETLILYVHGGAFHFLSARTQRCITSNLVSYTDKTCVFALNQRLAPEHSFNAAVEDVILVYLTLIGYRSSTAYSYAEHPLANLNPTQSPPDLLSTQRLSNPNGSDGLGLASRIWRPDQIVFAGDSSGGNSATSAVLVLKQFGLPVPAGLVLLSPWLDPPSFSQSWINNGHTCYLPHDLPGLYDGLLEFCKPLSCTHPFVSPLYATKEMLTGLPPVLIQVGGGEALYDEAIEWGECIASVGGHVRIEVFDGLFHVFQAFRVQPVERHIAFTNISNWISNDLPRLMRSHTPAADNSECASIKTKASAPGVLTLDMNPLSEMDDGLGVMSCGICRC